jgi:hypothetical protein
MVLESTIICVDNSEYTRNGDYLPTRLQAQQASTALFSFGRIGIYLSRIRIHTVGTCRKSGSLSLAVTITIILAPDPRLRYLLRIRFRLRILPLKHTFIICLYMAIFVM